MSWTLKFQATSIEVKAWSALKFDVVAEIDDSTDLKDQIKDIFDEAMDEEFERGKEDAESDFEQKEIEDFWLHEIIDHLETEYFNDEDKETIREFCKKFLEENP
jgi:hypothetical protein